MFVVCGDLAGLRGGHAFAWWQGFGDGEEEKID